MIIICTFVAYMHVRTTFLAFFTVCFVWTFSWIILKYQSVMLVDNFCSLSYRFIIGSLCCFIIAKKMKYRLTIPLKFYIYPLISGSTNVFLSLYLTYKAAAYIPSGLIPAISSLAIVTNEIFSDIIKREKPTVNVVICGFMAVIGVILFTLPTLKYSPDAKSAFFGVSLMILEAIIVCPGFYATKTFFSKTNGISYVTYVGHILLVGAIWSLIGMSTLKNPVYFDFSHRYILSILYSAIFATTLGYLGLSYLISRIGEGKASYTKIIYTAGAIIISTLFEDYAWKFINIFGFFMIIFGIYSRFGNQKYLDFFIHMFSKLCKFLHITWKSKKSQQLELESSAEV